jgi:protein-S-isoprenylcysteine O-methyltransferase Ste14
MTATTATARRPGRQIWLRGLLAPLILVPLIFIPAGTLSYWQGWVYLALNLGVVFVTIYALRSNPELIQERLKPGKGMKRFDKVYFGLTTPLYLFGVILAALDAGRFNWSPPLPWWVYAVGIALFVAGQGIFLWAKVVNRFFSSVVRIQTERGHAVCRGGPYRYVRHPGYSGSLVWTLAAPLILGSVWALLPAVLSDALLIWRTAKEDETLRRELIGYSDYAGRVKYRLVPGIW